MGKSIQIEVRQFSEFPEDKQLVIAKHDSIITPLAKDSDRRIRDQLCSLLHNMGYPTNDLRFTLGKFSRDGVAFYGSINLRNLKRITMPAVLIRPGVKEFVLEHVTFSIKKIGFCEDTDNSMEVIVEGDPSDHFHEGLQKEIKDALEILKNSIQDDIRSASVELLFEGKDLYNKYTHPEFIRKILLESNDWFLPDGRFYCKQQNLIAA